MNSHLVSRAASAAPASIEAVISPSPEAEATPASAVGRAGHGGPAEPVEASQVPPHPLAVQEIEPEPTMMMQPTSVQRVGRSPNTSSPNAIAQTISL